MVRLIRKRSRINTRKMNKKALFNKTRIELREKLRFLKDKPEENIDSSLKALWHKAAGNAVSAEKASELPLPDLTGTQVETLHQLIKLRQNNIPLAHITGRQNFLGIELLSDKRALIPRKETELLGKKAIELSLEVTKKKGRITVIDVGCGSGNLGLAIAYFNPDCTVLATDISQDAVDLTKENIKLLGLDNRVTVKQGDVLSAYDTDGYYTKIDITVCNPPYISSAKVPSMDIEISAHEPSLAFDGGMLGTSVIQRLIRETPKLLPDNGFLIFEVGLGQGPFIIQLCERTQLYSHLEPIYDDSGNVRVILARK
jgi:release factor glutamine methyltransferase